MSLHPGPRQASDAGRKKQIKKHKLQRDRQAAQWPGGLLCCLTAVKFLI